VPGVQHSLSAGVGVPVPVPVGVFEGVLEGVFESDREKQAIAPGLLPWPCKGGRGWAWG
jgi:hypothetical protein